MTLSLQSEITVVKHATFSIIVNCECETFIVQVTGWEETVLLYSSSVILRSFLALLDTEKIVQSVLELHNNILAYLETNGNKMVLLWINIRQGIKLDIAHPSWIEEFFFISI